MRSPVRSVPDSVARWTSWARLARWLDAAVGWAAVWTFLIVAIPGPAIDVQALIAAVLTALGALIPIVRLRWRPVTAWIGLSVSRRLRPGDRAWWIRPDAIELVIVTARRGTRLVIAAPGHRAMESVGVRRTRSLFIPAE